MAMDMPFAVRSNIREVAYQRCYFDGSAAKCFAQSVTVVSYRSTPYPKFMEPLNAYVLPPSATTPCFVIVDVSVCCFLLSPTK